MVGVIEGLAEDWRRLDKRIERLSDEITPLAHQNAGRERLVSVASFGAATEIMPKFISPQGIYG
jgi:transposase